MRRRRDALSAAEHTRANAALPAAITEALRGLGYADVVERVASYFAFDGEVDPRDAVFEVFGPDVQVCLPRVEGASLDFVVVASWDELEHGTYGIPVAPGPAVDVASIDIVFVPGVAFDQAGNRLGMGKGYYDRVMSEARICQGRSADGVAGPNKKVPLFAGIAYQWQIVEEVPVAPFDQRVDAVIVV